MGNKRYLLKIAFKGSYTWDIEEEYRSLRECKKDAVFMIDNSVNAVVIEDKVTGLIDFCNELF